MARRIDFFASFWAYYDAFLAISSFFIGRLECHFVTPATSSITFRAVEFRDGHEFLA